MGAVLRTGERPVSGERGIEWREPLLVLAALALAAFALRFATLGVQSLWLDEALSLRTITVPLANLPSELVHTQTSPPLYFLLVRLWGDVFGTSPLALRAFSALCGTLIVPVLYVAGRRFSTRAGWWAAALAATSSELLHFSQEIRGYALFALLVAIAFVLWLRALDAPTSRNLLAFSAVSVLALLTHYFAGFVCLGELVVLARRHDPRRLVLPVVIVGGVGAALVPLARAQNDAILSFIGQTPLLTRAAEAGKELLAGPYGPLGIVAAPAALLLATLSVGRLRRWPEPARRRLGDIALAGAIGVLVPVALAVMGIDDLVLGRNLIGACVPLIVLLAAGCAVGPWGSGLGVALCALSLTVFAGTVALSAYRRDDWRDAVTTLPRRPPRGGRVFVVERFGSIPLSLYRPGVGKPAAGAVRVTAAELDFIFLRRAHGGPWEPGEDGLGAPLPPAAPAAAPPAPFRLVASHRTSAYATYRFLASRASSITVGRLRRMFGDPGADLAVQR